MVSGIMTKTISFAHLSDRDLITEITALAARERVATASLIASLMELDTRELYLGEGCSSLFTYCTRVLHLSEHAAYGTIEAARAARRYPGVLDLLSKGALTLTTVCLLAPHLTAENHSAVLESARHKSKREVEQLIAALKPRPPVAAIMRKVPQPRAPGVQKVHRPARIAPPVLEAPSEQELVSPVGVRHRPVIVPLAPETYKVQFTMSQQMHDKLRRAQDLMRHLVPNGDVSAIFDRALTMLLEDLEQAKFAAAAKPRPPRASGIASRHVPADIKRKVWARDAGQCAFIGATGRCAERGFLEYHHVVPFAAGGATAVENLELRCRAHNQYESELFFGPMMVREVRSVWQSATRSGPS
jgi:hypothetical protein